MGVSAFFYAAEGDVDRVEAACREVWPEVLSGLVSTTREAGCAVEAIYQNADAVQLVLWQDGRFVGFAESELSLFETEPLRRLSEKLGTVLAVMIGDHGGAYGFGVFRNGELVRSIDNDGELEGEPIPEEAGVDTLDFSDDDIDAMWSAFGLRHFYDGVPPFRVLAPRAVAEA